MNAETTVAAGEDDFSSSMRQAYDDAFDRYVSSGAKERMLERSASPVPPSVATPPMSFPVGTASSSQLKAASSVSVLPVASTTACVTATVIATATTRPKDGKGSTGTGIVGKS